MYDAGADRAPGAPGDDLDAFRRHAEEVPPRAISPLLTAIDTLPSSDDPAVMFARLARISVPQFSDGCEIDLAAGETAEPVVGAGSAERGVIKGVLLTPFQVGSRTGFESYAGVVTHWWNDQVPDDRAAVIAELLVRHVIAVVDRERLMAAMARSEDRAARSTLQAIAGRSISIAVGMVMKEFAVSDRRAEVMLRRWGEGTGRTLAEVSAAVLRGEQIQPAAGTEVAVPQSRLPPRDSRLYVVDT